MRTVPVDTGPVLVCGLAAGVIYGVLPVLFGTGDKQYMHFGGGHLAASDGFRFFSRLSGVQPSASDGSTMPVMPMISSIGGSSVM